MSKYRDLCSEVQVSQFLNTDRISDRLLHSFVGQPDKDTRRNSSKYKEPMFSDNHNIHPKYAYTDHKVVHLSHLDPEREG